MKSVKGLLLGSAAAFLFAGSVGTAQAGGLVEDKNYVEACETPGFIEMPGLETCFKIGGYVKADYIYNVNRFPSASEDLITPQHFFGNHAEDGDHVRFHGRQSRFNIDMRTPTYAGPLRAFIEGDFFNPSEDGRRTNTGNEVVSNSYNFRVRHAIIQWKGWLFGRTWSNSMALFALGETLDFGGAHGLTFLRQGQIRYTHKLGGGVSASISLENPETVQAARSDKSPDVVGWLQAAGAWGILRVTGVVRQLAYSDPTTGTQNETGYLIAGHGKINLPFLGAKDNLKFNVGYSDGGGRYIVGSLQDLKVTNAAGALDLATQWFASVAYQHHWNSKWRSNFVGSYVNDDDIGRQSYQGFVNVIWQATKQLSFGLEYYYLYADQDIEAFNSTADIDNVNHRIQFSVTRTF